MRMESLHEYIIFAHYLNFTTAANYLHISQPSLSKHIAEIEQELGFKLIKRGKTLQLTTAGMAFLEDTIQIHHAYKTTLERCRKIADQATEELRIQEPYILDAASEIIFKAVKRVKNSDAIVNVQLVSEKGKKSLESLDDGSVDIALTVDCNPKARLEKVSDRKNLRFIPLVEEPLFVWLRNDHYLTRRGNITLDDLVGVTINMIAARRFDPMRFALIDLFKSIGKQPTIQSYPSDTLNEFFIDTQDKKAIFLVSASVTKTPLLQMQRDMIPLAIDDPRAVITTYLVFKSEAEKRLIEQFIETTKQVIEHDISRQESTRYLTELT